MLTSNVGLKKSCKKIVRAGAHRRPPGWKLPNSNRKKNARVRTRQRYKSKARGRRAAVVRHPRKRTHVTRFNARSYIVNKIDIFKFNNLLPWISKFWTPPASTELSKIHGSSWDFGNIWRIICKNVRFGPHWCLLIFGRFRQFWEV